MRCGSGMVKQRSRSRVAGPSCGTSRFETLPLFEDRFLLAVPASQWPAPATSARPPSNAPSVDQLLKQSVRLRLSQVQVEIRMARPDEGE